MVKLDGLKATQYNGCSGQVTGPKPVRGCPPTSPPLSHNPGHLHEPPRVPQDGRIGVKVSFQGEEKVLGLKPENIFVRLRHPAPHTPQPPPPLLPPHINAPPRHGVSPQALLTTSASMPSPAASTAAAAHAEPWRSVVPSSDVYAWDGSDGNTSLPPLCKLGVNLQLMVAVCVARRGELLMSVVEDALYVPVTAVAEGETLVRSPACTPHSSPVFVWDSNVCPYVCTPAGALCVCESVFFFF